MTLKEAKSELRTKYPNIKDYMLAMARFIKNNSPVYVTESNTQFFQNFDSILPIDKK